MSAYLILSAITFAVLFVVWSKDGWINTFLKTIFFCMMIFGICCVISDAGFLVKAPGGMRWL